ncbi:hypothetical protein [Streptomyces sp. NPDC048057]|uniref:hypothetical protein n=1 Tax=Streptomyces sp. NPDC048057 TaxID=3155628 RepID=UPI0033D6DD6E
MIPTLRKRCAITVGSLLVLASPLSHANDLGPGAAAPGGSFAAVPAAATPDPTGSFAGRLAGEGHPRPGRAPQSADPDASLPAESQPAEPWTPDRSADADTGASAGTDGDGDGDADADGDADGGVDASVSQSRPSAQDGAADQEPNADPEADAELDPVADPQPELTANAPTAARQRPAQPVDTAAEQQVSPVSLGVGMALMGLGIGFLGLRLRRR